jgi:hypothetical protein
LAVFRPSLDSIKKNLLTSNRDDAYYLSKTRVSLVIGHMSRTGLGTFLTFMALSPGANSLLGREFGHYRLSTASEYAGWLSGGKASSFLSAIAFHLERFELAGHTFCLNL